jgi:hypothetical protein
MPDAGPLAPVVSISEPGPMVLDGKSLVLTSTDLNGSSGALVRVALGSWTVTKLAGGDSSLFVSRPLTADAQRFYFLGGPTYTAVNAIYALPRAGGTPIQITGIGTIFADNSNGAGYQSGLAVDAGRIYWIEYVYTGDPSLHLQPPSRVMAAPLAGGPATAIYTVSPPEMLTGALTTDATQLYFTTTVSSTQNRLYAMPSAGGPPTVVSQSAIASIADDGWGQVTIDAGFAYLLDFHPDPQCTSKGDLVRVPLAGGAPSTLFAGVVGARTFALGSGNAYLGSSGSCDPNTVSGSIDHVPLAGGPSANSGTGAWTPVSIVVDGADVYVSAAAVFTTPPGGEGILHLTH